MCGLVGYISKKSWNLKKAVCSLNHRGPDYQEHRIFEYQDKYIGLGHARLSIIDLNPKSHQPMTTEDGKYEIIYNGEIYNFKSLRESLNKEGISFRTKSDTEVLLKYYRANGTEGFRDLEGMFAFVIYDKVNQEIVLVRDQLGIKPLYYWKNQRGIFWSSELKGIWQLTNSKAPLDDHVFEEFLCSGFVYEPGTGFKNVYKIPPASFLKIDINDYSQNLDLQKYWSVGFRKSSIREVKGKVSDSINSHLVSDVPLGLFYSGGVDSTVILSEVKRDIKSFIVKSSEEEYEEAGITNDFVYGQKIAEHLEADIEVISLEKKIDEDSLLDNITEIAKLSEEPIQDFTFVSSMLLSKVARDKGFKVMLSGMGADEIFAGYPRYRLAKYGKYFSWIFPIIKPLMKLSKYLEKKVERFENYFEAEDFAQKYSTLLTPFSRQDVDSLLKNEANFEEFDSKISNLLKTCPFESPLKKAIYLDIYGFLSHNFLVADKSSMQAGLELRVPLATPELYEICMNLPDYRLMKLNKSKLILKDMLYDILPKNLIDRKKAGFHPPLDNKIKNLGKEKIHKFVENNHLFEKIKEDTFQEILEKHFNSSKNNTLKIYRLMYLSAWYNENR